MPEGPLNGPRPGSDSTLLLRIRETPVPEKDPEPLFPMKIIRATNTEKAILEEIVRDTSFGESQISIDRSTSVQRGLGQTDVWEMRVDVSGLRPSDVAEDVDNLVNAGFKFEIVEFE